MVATGSVGLLSPFTSSMAAPDATFPISQLDSAADASICLGGLDGTEATIVELPVPSASSGVETSDALLGVANADGAVATIVEHKCEIGSAHLALTPVPFAFPTVETSGASPGVAKGLEMGSNDPHVLRLCMTIVRQRCGAARRTPWLRIWQSAARGLRSVHSPASTRQLRRQRLSRRRLLRRRRRR